MNKEELILPRWVLYLTYLIIAVQGVFLAIADSIAVPKLSLADYLIPYGSSVTVLSLLSLWAAWKRWEWVECLSTFFLFAGLTSFVWITLFDWINDTTDRGALGIVTALVLLITLARSAVLFLGLLPRRRRSQ